MPKVRRSRLNQLPNPQSAEAEARSRGIEIIEDVQVGPGPTPPQPIAPPWNPFASLREPTERYLASLKLPGAISLPVPETLKMAQDTALSGLGAAALAPMPGGIPLGSMAGQAFSDYLAGSSGDETAFNAALAGGLPLGTEALTRTAALIPGISPYAVRQAFKASGQSPLGVGGLRVTRPVVGLGKNAEKKLAGKLEANVAQEFSSTPGKVAQRQITEKAAVLDKYRNFAQIDPYGLADDIRRGFRNNYQSHNSNVIATPEVEGAKDVWDQVALTLEEVGTANGGVLNLSQVEDALAQVRDSIGAAFDTPGGSLKIMAYKDIQASIKQALGDTITDPADKALYDEVTGLMEARLDARDALRQELGRMVTLEGEDVFKGAGAVIRSVNTGTGRGDYIDDILKAYDDTHDTQFYWKARRLKLQRNWSPDERTEAGKVLGIIRAALSPVARLGAKLGAPLTGVLPQVLPTARGLMMSQGQPLEDEE